MLILPYLKMTDKYSPGKITKTTASKLFMNAKSLYDNSGKVVNMFLRLKLRFLM